MTRRPATDHIVVHCAATPPNVDVGVREIRQWHIERGFGRIGYHIVIRRNGKIEYGCPINDIGIHVRGHNRNTVAVCMVGGVDTKMRPQDNFTDAQWRTLERVLRDLQARYPNATVLGHRDFPDVHKACPSFNAILWARKRGLRAAPQMRPLPASALFPAGYTEVEDDERDDDFMDGETPTAGAGKWTFGSSIFGGMVGLGGYGYGMDGMTIVMIVVLMILVAGAALYLMGYERRERLWDRIVGT